MTRTLDQEFGAAVPKAARFGIVALRGIHANHWKLRCRDLGQLIRKVYVCPGGDFAYDYSCRLVLDADSQSEFFSNDQLPRDGRFAYLRVFVGSFDPFSSKSQCELERQTIWG